MGTVLKKLVLAELRALRICGYQASKFELVFGDIMELTEQNWKMAIAINLDISWLANNYLSKEQKELYIRVEKSAYEVYKSAKLKLRAKYVQNVQRAYVEYLHTKLPIYIEGLETGEPAYREYKLAQSSALEVYDTLEAIEYKKYKEVKYWTMYNILIEDCI